MKRILFEGLSVLMSIGFAACAVSCPEDEQLPPKDEHPSEKEPEVEDPSDKENDSSVSGQWLFSKDNIIAVVSLSEDGVGTLLSYAYESGEWVEETLQFQYILSAATMTVILPEEEENLVLKYTVQENTMSVTYVYFTFNLSRYDGDEGKIDELKKEIEENWTESELV